MDYLLALFEERGLKATFFWLGDAAGRCPELLMRTHNCGHEVALHHLHHDFIYKSTADVFRSELRQAKDFLEQRIGSAVRGFRAPFFSISNTSLWAIEVLAELGFQYDSSIIPFRHYRYGIPGAPYTPYLIDTASGSILEIPVATVRRLGIRIPASGGAYTRQYPYALSKSNLNMYQQSGSVPLYYCHPWEFDAEQPHIRMPFPTSYLHYYGLKDARMKFERLLADFRVLTMHDYIRQLRTLSHYSLSNLTNLPALGEVTLS